MKVQFTNEQIIAMIKEQEDGEKVIPEVPLEVPLDL